MFKVIRKPEAVESLQTSEVKDVNVVERPCRSCENFMGVTMPHNVDAFNVVTLDCYYSCRSGLFLSAATDKDNVCPINSFKYRDKGEITLTPESLKENGFRKLSYEKDFVRKLSPNHPQAKHYGEIIIFPGEELVRRIYQIYDVWIKKEE